MPIDPKSSQVPIWCPKKKNHSKKTALDPGFCPSLSNRTSNGLVHYEGSIFDAFSTIKLFQAMLGFSCWYQEMSDNCINIRLVISARIIGEISSFRINAGIRRVLRRSTITIQRPT